MSLPLPPRLGQGSRVALVAPAGPVAPERVDAAVERLRALGLDPVPGASASRQTGYLAGSDAERLADLQTAFDDPTMDAVWALRGGYGTMRLIGHLDLRAMRSRPKPFIGFSDNTAVHLVLRAAGITSFHAPHAAGDWSPLAERCLHRVLWHAEAAGPLETADAPIRLRPGTADGPLVGGNLALLAALCGTPAQPDARGCILFVEDIGEAPYRLDRAWAQLRLAGVLDGIAGLAFGQFTECGDGSAELVQEFADSCGVPALAGLPIGHEPDNWTLPVGIRARLDADAGTLSLLQAAVT